MKFRLPYLKRWFDRRLGRERFAVRRPGHRLIGLPGSPSSPEFLEAYHAALNGRATQPRPQPTLSAKRLAAGTINAALAGFLTSPQWLTETSAGTRTARRPIYERFREECGHLPLQQCDAETIELYLRQFTPHAALNRFKALRAFFKHARHDIFREIEKPKAKSKKRESWSDAQIAQFEAHHAIGTKARLAFALAKHCGPAAIDLARLGSANLRAGVMIYRRQKTGEEAIINIADGELPSILAATPLTGLSTFLVTDRGRPYSSNDLAEQFRAWCRQAALPEGLTIHGLRHSLGDRLAIGGASALQIACVLGHADARMAERYTKGADRTRMALAAIAKLKG
jgi:integrase